MRKPKKMVSTSSYITQVSISASNIMETHILTFENVPKAISRLIADVNEIKKVLSRTLEPAATKTRKLDSDRAIQFFFSHGFKLSRSRLYKLTSLKQIPFSKFGNKLVFDEDELLMWLENLLKSPLENDSFPHSVVQSATKNYTRYGK